MPLVYTYSDKYLEPLVTVDIETRATADVAMDGSFPAEHTAKLVRLRAYVITCTECQKATDDVFAAKLSAYRKEYAEALTRARIAQAALDAATSGSAGSVFSIELVRG